MSECSRSPEQQGTLQQGSWIKNKNPNRLNNTEANITRIVWVQLMIGSSFILCTKNSDGKAVIYREHLHRSTSWMRKTTYTHPYLGRGERGTVFLDFGKLTHACKREARCPKTQESLFLLVWLHSASSVGHLISRVLLALLYWQSTAMTRKEEPAHWGWRGGQGAWLTAGRSDPTLWGPLSLLTGEPQDLLDITGLRGGLPKTNISPFKSAWKSHKKLVSSHLHYTAFRRSFPVLFSPMHTQHAKLLNKSSAGRGNSLQTALVAARSFTA